MPFWMLIIIILFAIYFDIFQSFPTLLHIKWFTSLTSSASTYDMMLNFLCQLPSSLWISISLAFLQLKSVKIPTREINFKKQQGADTPGPQPFWWYEEDICNVKATCSTVFEISHTQKYVDRWSVSQTELNLMSTVSDLVRGTGERLLNADTGIGGRRLSWVSRHNGDAYLISFKHLTLMLRHCWRE